MWSIARGEECGTVKSMSNHLPSADALFPSLSSISEETVRELAASLSAEQRARMISTLEEIIEYETSARASG